MHTTTTAPVADSPFQAWLTSTLAARVEAPVDLSVFLEDVERWASLYNWQLYEDRKIRTDIDGVLVCPLSLLAYVSSDTRPAKRVLPQSAEKAAYDIGMTAREAAAAVHVIDGLERSPHWRQEWRDRLLVACKLAGVRR